MTIEARRIKRGVSAALLALTLILVAAVPSAQADTIYPDNKITGTSFDLGLDGWTEFANSCTLLFGGLPSTNPQVCQTRTLHNAGVGTPPGSLEQRYNGTANGLGDVLFQAVAEARSPSFVMGPNINGATGEVTFQFDRRADVNTIVDVDTFAQYVFTLRNLTAGTSEQLFFENLNDLNNVFEGRLRVGLLNSVPGNVYRIDLTTTFQCGILCAGLQEVQANFDNLRLRVKDGTPGFGPATAETLDATAITNNAATLNGITNAQGVPNATYTFRYGTTQATVTNGTEPTTTGTHSAGSRLDDQPRSRDVSGLAPCLTYFFRIEATNTAGPTGVGATKSFRTDCAPTVETLPTTGISATAATLNSSINPEIFLATGPNTTFFYEYRVKGSTGAFTQSPAGAPISGGRRLVQPNSVPIVGLVKQTTYEARVVATNNVGTTVDPTPVEFTTAGDGAQGPAGPQGTAGTNGTNGATGATGAQGPAGTQGPAGIPGGRGPAGAQGPKGNTPTVGQGFIENLLSTDVRAMIRVDAKTILVPLKGRNIGRARIQVFCRRVAVKTCFGNVKVRTVAKINPASLGRPAKTPRRVTFDTDDVQLDVGKIGFAILDFNAQRRGLLQRTGPIRSTVIISVIDAQNNRQNIRATLTVVPGKR